MKITGILINLLALGLFFPGIFLPMFSLNIEMQTIMANMSGISSTIIDNELSIMQTVDELWRDDRLLVAALIFIFSVCIPLLKTLLVTMSYPLRHGPWGDRLLAFVSHIGKWSMADVFVVAVFLAVLSTNHAQTAETHNFTLFGFKLALQISSQTLSAVGDGFYYFVAYCVASLFGTQLALWGMRRRPPQAN